MNTDRIQLLRQDIHDLIAEQKEVKAELNKMVKPQGYQERKAKGELVEKLAEIDIKIEYQQDQLAKLLLKDQPTLF